MCLAAQVRAQFTTINDDIAGVLTFPSLLGGVPWAADG